MLINYVLVPLFSIFILLCLLVSSSFSLNSSYFFNGLIFDEYSIFLILITCFVIFISFIFCFSFISFRVSCSLVLMLLVCSFAFSTNNMFYFYLSYEASLVPILYIIIKWGSYPERSVRSMILLVYTACFTFPFLYAIMTLYLHQGSFSFSFLSVLHSSSLFSVLVFFSFAVKLPIYGLHFWLPIAHVEAPTFGSIVLAGVLLKLGGIGLIRFSNVISVPFLKHSFLAYFLVFLCYVTMLCCFQSDFKRLVAYSSVSHMMTIPVIFFSSSFLGNKGMLRVMFLHGLSSPLMFMLVGIAYSFFFTRQHVLMRGILTFSPLLSFFIVLAFFFTLSAPPFPSFLAEVMFAVSSLFLWNASFVFVVIFLFLSIVYNLLWLSSLNFLNQDSIVNYTIALSFSHFLPLVLSLFMMPVVFSSLFYFIL